MENISIACGMGINMCDHMCSAVMKTDMEGISDHHVSHSINPKPMIYDIIVNGCDPLVLDKSVRSYMGAVARGPKRKLPSINGYWMACF